MTILKLNNNIKKTKIYSIKLTLYCFIQSVIHKIFKNYGCIIRVHIKNKIIEASNNNVSIYLHKSKLHDLLVVGDVSDSTLEMLKKQ